MSVNPLDSKINLYIGEPKTAATTSSGDQNEKHASVTLIHSDANEDTNESRNSPTQANMSSAALHTNDTEDTDRVGICQGGGDCPTQASVSDFIADKDRDGGEDSPTQQANMPSAPHTEDADETYEEDEASPKTHEGYDQSESNSQLENEDDPPTEDGQNKESTSEGKNTKIEKSAESGGLIKSLKDKAKSGLNRIANVFMGYEKPVYEKKITIDLPHGKGPKTYCRYISYKPIGYELSPEPIITLTIKPNRLCEHEDTHLFMRFAGYYFKQTLPTKNKKKSLLLF